MPAVPASIIEPIWDQFAALLPPLEDTHPLGCHRPCIPDRVVFDTLVQVLVFGCAYQRIADATCSATPLRRRRDEGIAAGVLDSRFSLVLAADDRLLGLALDDIARRDLPAPITAGRRWVVERTTAWTNAHTKRVWCTERRAVVIAFWMTFSAVLIVVGRLGREGWRRYRWDGRPARKPSGPARLAQALIVRQTVDLRRSSSRSSHSLPDL